MCCTFSALYLHIESTRRVAQISNKMIKWIIFISFIFYTVISVESLTKITNLRVSAIYKRRLHIEWDLIQNATNYRAVVIQIPTKIKTKDKDIIFKNNTAIVKNLPPRGTFAVKILANINESLIQSNLLNVKTDKEDGYGINATSQVTANTIHLQWSPVENATRYEIEYNVQNSIQIDTARTESTNITLERLESSKIYLVTIYAVKSNAGISPQSKQYSLVTLKSTPPPVKSISGLKATQIYKERMHLRWDLIQNATYKAVIIQIPTKRKSRDEDIIYKTNSAIVKNLVPGGIFAVRILGNRNGAIVSSNVIRVQSNKADVLDIKNVSIKPKASQSTLQWPSVAGAVQYVIELTAPNRKILTYTTSATTFSLTGLNSSTKYTVQIFSVANNTVRSPQSAHLSFTTTDKKTVASSASSLHGWTYPIFLIIVAMRIF